MTKEDKMDKRKRVREEVEKTMSLLDRMENLEAGPFFYTRVEARLRSKEREEKLKQPGIFGVKVLKPALLALLLVANLISAVFFLVGSRDTGLTEQNYRTHASQLAREYWPSQDTYAVTVTEKMMGESE